MSEWTHRNKITKRLCRVDGETTVKGSDTPHYWIVIDGDPVRELWDVPTFNWRHEPLQMALIESEVTA